MTAPPKSYIRKGVRCRLYASYGGRWGPGVTHVAIYDPASKHWHTACNKSPDFVLGDDLPYGEWVPAGPVTCKLCLKVEAVQP